MKLCSEKKCKNDKLAALLGVSLLMSHLFSLATHATTGTQCIQLPANEPGPFSSLPVIHCLLPLKTGETQSC